MATKDQGVEVQIDPKDANDPYEVATIPGYTVLIKSAWSDPWVVNDHLRPLRWTNTIQPAVPNATFRYDYGDIKAAWESTFTYREMPDLRDKYVMIISEETVSGEATDEDDANIGPQEIIHWFGVIVDPVNFYENVDTSDGSIHGRIDVHALGLEYLLGLIDVHTAYVDDGGSAVEVEFVPTMNSPFPLHEAPEQTASTTVGFLGNRSDAKISGSFVYSGDGDIWTHADYAEYVIKSFAQNGITFQVNAKGLPETFKSVMSFDGQSVRDILNRLMSRSIGVGWNIGLPDTLDNTSPWVITYDILDTFITLGSVQARPNPLKISNFIESDDKFIRNIEIRNAQGARYDYIKVVGERPRVCFSWSFDDGNAEIGWTASEETAYETAANANNGSEYSIPKQYERVFTYFRIPQAWDFSAADGIGGAGLDVRFSFDWRGSSEDTVSNKWRSFKTFLPALPLLEGYDYSGSAPVDNNPANSLPRFRRPIVFVKDDQTGGTGNYLRADVKEDWFEKASVSVDSKELGIHVKYPNQVALGRVGFASPNEPLKPKMPFDYNKCIFTTAIELDNRISVEISLPGPVQSDLTRTKVIKVPDCHYWLLHPGTVCDVDASGILQRPNNAMVLRDDVVKLQLLAAFAQSWYLKERKTVSAVRGKLESMVLPGHILVNPFPGDRLKEANTVVTSETFDLEVGTVSFTTGYDELNFGQLASAVNSGPVSAYNIYEGGPEAAGIMESLNRIVEF